MAKAGYLNLTPWFLLLPPRSGSFPQRVYRIGPGNFKRMATHRQGSDEQGHQAGTEKKQRANIYPIGKLVQVLTCCVPRQRPGNEYRQHNRARKPP